MSVDEEPYWAIKQRGDRKPGARPRRRVTIRSRCRQQPGRVRHRCDRDHARLRADLADLVAGRGVVVRGYIALVVLAWRDPRKTVIDRKEVAAIDGARRPARKAWLAGKEQRHERDRGFTPGIGSLPGIPQRGAGAKTRSELVRRLTMW